MAKVGSVAEAFDSYSKDVVGDERKAVTHLGGMTNGFENWLKIGFYLWLTSKRGLRPANDVGLEHKLQLDQRLTKRSSKQVDLWVRGSARDYHYVEFKVVFNNGNRSKMLKSAANDVIEMSRARMVSEQLETGNAVVVGVGFGKQEWHRLVNNTVKPAKPRHDVEVSYGLLGGEKNLPWAVITLHPDRE